MKKWTMIVIIGLLTTLLGYEPTAAQATNQHQVQLMINGEIEYPEVPALIKDGRTLVPLRFISEKIGAHVEWLPATKEIKIYKGERLLELQLGSKEIKVNGRTEYMDIAPHLEQERTLVPIRFVSQYLDLNVGWEESERMVLVSNPIYVYVNGLPLAEANTTFLYHQQLYLPIDTVAEMLDVELNYQEEYLPSIERLVIDGVEMAPLASIDPWVGTITTWDIEKNIVYISTLETDGGTEETELINTLPTLLDYSIDEGSYRFELSKEFVQPTYFFLEHPLRLVVDLPHTLLAGELMNSLQSGMKIIDLEDEMVEQIRLSQFSSSPYTVRLVFDLKHRADVSIEQVDRILEISITKRIPLVVIDAGHGGADPGALGQYSQEKEVNLGIVLKLLSLLEADPEVRVLATRIDDSYPTLDERVELANQNQADMFVSVHANASHKKSIGGTETYIYFNDDRTFGKIIHKHLIDATGLLDRGLKEANYKVIRETYMPAVLVEVAFISNAYEENLLNDPAFQEKVALALYTAIKEYETGK